MAERKSENRAGDVELDVAVVLGHAVISIESLLEWSEGSLLELEKRSGDAADMEVNGTPFAKGEVVTIGVNYGIRLIEIHTN